ncbi:IclR family transcriptional regulator [Roseobacter cerasinus]|uniref:IclR family transcriptional regulator n=1 Tax=Roseobacter cerasinus TaxID=2602289 RepID=A0A640VNL5_9RHOB|nr:IclR family transcriptional regulator [Roseobacter cerasinus]GFE49833.1 IclR family transcriptional regulator [Roseobacter cerasinus]
MSGDGTVGKALDVLDQVAAYGQPVRFATLLAESDFPKATLYRFLQTLTNQGMLEYDPERQTYALGVRLVRLAHAAWTQSSLAPLARPFLDKLSAETGQTVHLAQLDNAQVLYVDKRNAAQPVEMFSDAGKVGPAYCTGVGKAMLAFLPEEHLERVIAQQSFHRFTAHTYTTPEALCAELAAIRSRGYAFDREEHEPGIICIAHPILTATGRVLGAMSITGALQATDLEQLERWAPRLQRTAEAIAQEAQTWRFPDTHFQHTGT